jgi:hypothetical protein
MTVNIDAAPNSDRNTTRSGWIKCAVFGLAVVVVGLPINGLASYALLVLAATLIFSGRVRTSALIWGAAIAVVAMAVAAQIWLAPPRFDEGHNVFLPGGPTQALERGLPREVYDQLAAEFDKNYPPERRCKSEEAGCWFSMGFPVRAFAFSADGIFYKSDLSRSASALDFSDPVWLRLGFINELRYNWYPVSDVQRATRDWRSGVELHRWHLTMPWFEMIRLPAAYVGSQLCWRGNLMWEGSNEHFALLQGDQCRPVEAVDVDRRIVGLAIRPDTLAMRLTPPWSVRWLLIAQGTLTVVSLLAIMLMLVSFRLRTSIVSFVLLGLSILVIAAYDGSFIGGLRPLDSGDDGLFYDSVGRDILQALMSGDFSTFFLGAEKVFYYGGPGLRYFRAFEHILFGETFLGYLSLVLVLPFVVYAIFRRFLSELWALVLGIAFVATSLGQLFGTTFLNYVQWAERGFADPAAYIFFLAGLVPLLGSKPSNPTAGGVLKSDGRFVPAFFGALLLAFGIFMKPIIAPAAAIFLAGAGIAALYWRQWRRFIGLCVGFLPVFSMPLHNWVFGHVLVLFSANAAHPLVLDMPPSAYADAFRELITLDFSQGYLRRALMKLPEWLSSGPGQSLRTAPLNAIGVVMLFYVVCLGRRFDPWLRLLGGAALVQHGVALFYVPLARYHYLTWFLTAVVALTFMREIGFVWLSARFPKLSSNMTDVVGNRLAVFSRRYLEQNA